MSTSSISFLSFSNPIFSVLIFLPFPLPLIFRFLASDCPALDEEQNLTGKVLEAAGIWGKEMGRRRGWFSAVKKALGSEHGDQRSRNLKKMGFGKRDGSAENEPDMVVTRTVDEVVMDVPWNILEEPYVFPFVEERKLAEVVREEKGDARLTDFSRKSKEEAAAIRIQTAFRGLMGRRKLRGLRGGARLRSLMQGSSIERQTAVTLRCMQTLWRVQSQIRGRRVRMSEENQALQRQLQQKHEKEMEEKMKKITIGDDWNDSTKSKEKIEASLRYRQEAGMRRERGLAYALSHQQKWRNGLRGPNPDPINSHWGWSWLERWMAARPWEGGTAADNGGATSAVRALSVDEISKAYYAHRARDPDITKPLLTPQRSSILSDATKPNRRDQNSRSISRVQSGQQRRHSVASSSMSHNASLSSTHTISARSYMTSSEAHRAKARLQKSSSSSDKSNRKLEIGLPGSVCVKKRLSCVTSSTPSAARRHSGPPKV